MDEPIKEHVGNKVFPKRGFGYLTINVSYSLSQFELW